TAEVAGVAAPAATAREAGVAADCATATKTAGGMGEVIAAAAEVGICAGGSAIWPAAGRESVAAQAATGGRIGAEYRGAVAALGRVVRQRALNQRQTARVHDGAT